MDNRLTVLDPVSLECEKVARTIINSPRITPEAKQSLIEIYTECVRTGIFSIDEIIECAIDRDESAIMELAEFILHHSNDTFYEQVKEMYGDSVAYDEAVDDIAAQFLREEDIFLCVGSICGKQAIPNIYCEVLDSMNGAYFIIDPQPCSIQEYMGETRCALVYNDAQNTLVDGVGFIDSYDNSKVNVIRLINERSMRMLCHQN